ncbi:MAG: N-acetylmuramoyl-L-alanine amidase family protein, partial [Solobacterium sp.]|nr:N-acetylmuramoyl-L-alanine amidase family protein [Solobacterium sp.]
KIIGEKVYNKDLQFSDCQPILLSDGTVSWYVSGRGMLKYYNIDPYHLNENNAHLVREYLVTFIDEDGTVLQSEKAEEGTTPVFHGDKPTKDPNQQYIYEFDKWTPEIASVTGNITYQATYKSSLRKYAVTWLNEDGTVLETNEVEYGKTPAYSGTTPSKESAGEVTYVFTGWIPAIVPVTGTATYTATFKEATIDDIVKDLDNGWHEINSNWYYVESGKLVKGWKQSGSTWYYMDPETGVMQTGLQEIKGSKYIFANSGAMRTGWIDLDGTWYYAQASGALKTGWLQSGSTWYYMDPNTGEMATGWVKVGSSWYYMNSSGAMATGWVKDGGTWYYMNSSGAMVTGWVKVGNTWYYMKANGAMAASEWVTGYYWISASGAWTYQPVGSWEQNSTGWWFGDTSGWYAKNETLKINDVLYTFNAAGYWVK